MLGEGRYRIQGLPPGQYLVEIQEIHPDFTDGSSIGPLFNQFLLPVEEFYSGPRESGSDQPTDFEQVAVVAGQVANKAQSISIPTNITGAAADSDSSKFKMDLDGQTDKIEDLYRFTITNTTRLYIFLQPLSGEGDLDLYLFSSGVAKKKSSLEDPNLLDASLGLTANELVTIQLPPGTYIIGVSAFTGNANYRLSAITAQ
jgi:hypothetical protein